jgi:Secretion system C-terminal sorting domain
MKFKSLICIFFLLFIGSSVKAQLFNIGTIEKRCDTTPLSGELIFNEDGTSFGTFYTKPPNSPYYDAAIRKFDKDFNIIWQKSYGGSGLDGFSTIHRLSADRLLILGGTSSSDGDVPYGYPSPFPQYGSDSWLLIIDTLGNVLHGITYGTGCGISISGLSLTSDGKIFIAGSGCSQSEDFIANTQPMHYMGYVALLDSHLNKKWFLPMNSPYDVRSQKFQMIYNDTFVMAYYVQKDDTALFKPINPLGNDFLVTHFFHIDTNMNITQHYNRGCSSMELFYTTVNHEDKTYTSIYQSKNDGDYSPPNLPFNVYKHCILAEISKDGKAVWKEGIHLSDVNGTNLNQGIDMNNIAITDSFIYAIGYVQGDDDSIFGPSFGKGNDYDMIVCCFNKSSGKLIGRTRIGDSTGDDQGWIKVAPNGKVYVYYVSQPVQNVKSRRYNCSNWQTKAPIFYLLELYNWPLSAAEPVISKAALRIFPNPADKKVTIGFENDDGILFGFKIFSLEGKEIYGRNDIYKQIEVDVSNFVKGTYLVEVNRNGKRYDQKIVVQ